MEKDTFNCRAKNFNEVSEQSTMEMENESLFDENGFIKNQRALMIRKQQLNKEWLQEMPSILEKFKECNRCFVQNCSEDCTLLQIHNYIFAFFDNKKVLFINEAEYKYEDIQNMSDYYERVWGPNHQWMDSFLCIEISFSNTRDTKIIEVDFDPYNVSLSIIEKISKIIKDKEGTGGIHGQR